MSLASRTFPACLIAIRLEEVVGAGLALDPAIEGLGEEAAGEHVVAGRADGRWGLRIGEDG